MQLVLIRFIKIGIKMTTLTVYLLSIITHVLSSIYTIFLYFLYIYYIPTIYPVYIYIYIYCTLCWSLLLIYSLYILLSSLSTSTAKLIFQLLDQLLGGAVSIIKYLKNWWRHLEHIFFLLWLYPYHISME